MNRVGIVIDLDAQRSTSVKDITYRIGTMIEALLNNIEQGLIKVAELVSSSKTFKALTENRLSGDRMGDEGAKSLASALQSPTCKVTYIKWVIYASPRC